MSKLSFWGTALILSALILSGCSTTKAQSNLTQAVLEVTEGVRVVRDAVLAYLAENYGDEAPAAGLAWTEKHTKPEGLVGGESYEYTAGDWVIVVSYPVVAPENVVYTIDVSNQAVGLRWEGQVDAQGQVTETSFSGQSSRPSDPKSDMPNPASVYCEQNGGKLEFRQDASGGVSGVCIFPDDSECDEWAYFRNECKPGDTLTTPIPTASPQIASDGWKIYRNAELGYSFHYPADTEIVVNDEPLKSISIVGPLIDNEYWLMTLSHPRDRDDYHPPEGVDLRQWLIDHYLLGDDERLPDVQIAGTTAIHLRHERSPQSYAFDRYYFAKAGQLYMVTIGHTDKEDWELYNHFLQSFHFENQEGEQ